jgi:methylmalonyl-CoA mutase N-terminal domain/subunit
VEEQDKIELLRIDPEVEQKQVRRLKALKERRDNDAVSRALARITAVAKSGDNLMPAIIEAVRVYGTVGEISDAIREQFGQFDPPVFL